MTAYRFAYNKNMYGILQSITVYADDINIGGIEPTLYPEPTFLIGAYGQHKAIPIEQGWDAAELMLRLMLSAAETSDKRAA